MTNNISSDMLFAAACLVYIFSGIFCGITRWLHMCKPYDENGDYFYPGRKQATFFFSAILLQFPYLLHPTDAETWTYIRVFGILYYPICFSLLFKRYFGRERLKRNNKKFFYFSVPFLAIGLMLVSVLFCNGAFFTGLGNGFLAGMGLLSVLLTAGYFQETQRIKKNIKLLNEKDYSNPEDFPYYFAKKVYYLPLIWIAAMWVLFLTESHWVKFIVDIVCAFWMVYFLNVILHPQQFFSNARQQEKLEEMNQQISDIVNNYVNFKDDNPDEDLEAEESGDSTPFEYLEEGRKEVLKVMLRKFQNPHLLKSDVLMDISAKNKNEAKLFIKQVGYYNLVNSIRLKYSVFYADSHPKVTKDEVATASGFSSRFALNKVRKREIPIDPRILDEVIFDS